jgi:addiction module HigA family antidote
MCIAKHTNRNPIRSRPGDILRYEFLLPLCMEPFELAQKMGVSLMTVNGIVLGKLPIDKDIAKQLSNVLDTTAEFWLNLQKAWDNQ